MYTSINEWRKANYNKSNKINEELDFTPEEELETPGFETEENEEEEEVLTVEQLDELLRNEFVASELEFELTPEELEVIFKVVSKLVSKEEETEEEENENEEEEEEVIDEAFLGLIKSKDEKIKLLSDATKLDKNEKEIKSNTADFIEDTTHGGESRAKKYLPNLYAYFKGTKSLNDIKAFAKNDAQAFTKEIAHIVFKTYVVSQDKNGKWVDKAAYGGSEGLAGGTGVGGGTPTEDK